MEKMLNLDATNSKNVKAYYIQDFFFFFPEFCRPNYSVN